MWYNYRAFSCDYAFLSKTHNKLPETEKPHYLQPSYRGGGAPTWPRKEEANSASP